jgi:hypothetical protein
MMQPKKLIAAVTCCALVLATQTLRADDMTSSNSEGSTGPGSLRVGARVRLNESEPKMKTLIGQVLRLYDVSLLLQVREDDPPFEIRRSEIHSLEVSVARHSHTTAGAVIGGILFGLVATAWITYAHAYDEGSCNSSCFATRLTLHAVPVAGLGAFLGGLAGSGATTDEWQTPMPKRVSARVVPTGHGVAASLSFRF